MCTLFGCSITEEERKGSIEQVPCDFIFRLQHFLTDQDDVINFPLWFDDSIICGNRVKKITRSVYNADQGEVGSKEKIKEFIYEFSDKGNIKRLTVRSFYENVLFNDVTFDYLNVKDSEGYTKVKVEDNYNFSKTSELNKRNYQLYSKTMGSESYSMYKNDNANKYQIFMLDTAYWGGISVDTICAPEPEDVVTFGHPQKPIKRYQVKNKVEEFNVTTFTYAEGSNKIKKWRRKEYPFETLRTITFSKNGNCIGFIDSIFSDDEYLSRKLFVFEFDDNKFPIKLGMESSSEHDKNTILQRETYEYEYF